MRNKVKDVLARLVDKRDASGLSDDDWALLDEAVGKRAAADADAPRPLWAFIREQTSRWKMLLELPLDWMGSELDAILLEAGADPALRFDNARSRKAAVITRAALSASVKKHLSSDQSNLRAWAYLLIGLARLDEHVGVMVEALASGREERESWTTTTTVPPMLESLAMLEHPRSAELAKKFLNHQDDRLRRAAQTCTLLHPPEDDKLLAEQLDAGISAGVLLAFPDQFVRAKKGGFDLEQRLRSLSQSHYRGPDHWTIADMALKAGLEDVYKDFLMSNSNYEGRIVCLHHAVANKRTEHFKEMLPNESDDNILTALVAGLGVTLPESERKAFLDDKLRNSSGGARMGAALAAVAVEGLDEALTAAGSDYDTDVQAALSWAMAGTCKPASPEMLEIASFKLARSWRVDILGLCGAMLRVLGMPVPDAVRDGELLCNRLTPWRTDERAEIDDFYKRRPDLLVRRLHPEIARDSDLRLRAARIAGQLGGNVFEEALEQRLDAADYNDENGELYLECLCHGGPRDPLGQLTGLLSLHEQAHPVTLPPNSLAAAVFLSMRNDSYLRSRAVQTMNQLGEGVEPFLKVLAHSVTDTTVGKAAGQALAQITSAHDPVVAELARLMSGEAKHLEDLELAELAIASGSIAVRAKLTELSPSGADDAALIRTLIVLAADSNDEVAVAALGALARRRGDDAWVRELVIATSRSSNWSLSRQAIDIMGSSGATGFVPRIGEILEKANKENDSDLGNRCVTALQNIADANAELGLLVLDVREPHLVNTRYGLNATIDWNADRRAEAHRLLLSALDQRKNKERAAGAKGKTVLFSRPGSQAQSVGKTVAADELESLLLYFKVTFADEETGSIVAEVGDDPTGEILTALLQSESVAVISAGWS